MRQTGKDDVVLILAGGVIFIKLLGVQMEVMRPHRGNEQRHGNIL